ncbi:hypothetical protein ACFSCZ_12215 [Siminovitchia sediminis]|uniref:DUF3311 domain-containing protein n=1 Tax=Siminovitchia sediminis TaxID=1274353 RepID=A0ABW4KH17_9BACI
MKINHNVIFVLILAAMVSLIVHPTPFGWANRIDPWVLGIPFVMFWVILICTLMCGVMILWYLVDLKKGNIDIDIEPATEEEMNSWNPKGGN